MKNKDKYKKKKLHLFMSRMNVRFGIPYLVITIFFVLLFATASVWATYFLYEPAQESAHRLNNPLFIFIILFLPTTSIIVGIITVIKFIIDTLKRKQGAVLRLIIVIIMALITVLPSSVVSYFSIYVIMSNLNIWLDESTDKSLLTLIEYSREKISDKRVQMQFVLLNLAPNYFSDFLINTEINKDAEKRIPIELLEYFTALTIISNRSILFNNSTEPAIDIADGFTNDTTIFINSEFNNKFYINAVIPFFSNTNKENTSYAVWTEVMPENFIEQRNNALAAFRLYRSIDMFTKEFSAILILLYIFILGVSTFFTIILGIILSRLITNPIAIILDAADSIINANFDINIKLRGAPDMRTLIHRFNVMARSLQYHREQEDRRARLETWREAAIKVAHEIKNPLTPILINAELIKKKIKRKINQQDLEKIDCYADTIIRSTNTINSLVGSFSEFSFPIRLSSEKISINSVLEESTRSFMEFENITLHLSLTKYDLFINMDREKLSLAFVNLIKNACEAIEPKGRGDIYISTYHEIVNREKEYFVISIADTGIGIKQDDRARIFEPYFTSKGKGTGLGLPMVETTFSEHDAVVAIESTEGEGTTFFITFDT